MFSYLKEIIFEIVFKILEFLFAKKKSKIILIKEFNSPSEKGKVCVFAHFDPSSSIRDYVFSHLESLRKAGFYIVFVSVSNLPESEIEKLQRICGACIVRENIGYDFGSWVEGTNYLLSKTKISELIFTNDSIYGPFHDLGKIIFQMKQKKYDFWGMTNSYEIAHHIQSYFLFISEHVIESEMFRKFLKDFIFFPSFLKVLVIKKYEVGFSRAVMKNFSSGVWISYLDLIKKISEDELAKRKLLNQYRNPTLYLWDILIDKFKFPYLKRDLIRYQKSRGYRRTLWIKLVGKYPDIERMIQADLNS